MATALLASTGASVQASAAPTKNQVPILDNQGCANLPAADIAGNCEVGSLSVGFITITTSITIGVVNTLVRVDCTSGSLTETLPPAASVPGLMLIFKRINSGANTVTIAGNGAETIDGSNTNTSLSSQYAVLRIISNGVGWDIV